MVAIPATAPPDDQGAAAEPVDPREAVRLKTSLQGIANRLGAEATRRMGLRLLIETRWLEDLRQIEGEYEPKTRKELIDANKSTLFINQTRPKTAACEAKLGDMLFPTDDKNWGITPTAVPELDRAAQDAVVKVKKAAAQANEALQQQNQQGADAAAAAGNQHADAAQALKEEMDEARKRCEAMSDEIEDQLQECSYNIQARDSIRDACRIGTGILKGPVASMDRVRRSWTKQQDQTTGAAIFTLQVVEDPRPAYFRVDPWMFFPDPDARTIRESESTLELHIKTAKDMRSLARQPGFDPEAIRRLLKSTPTKQLPQWLAQLREITAQNPAPVDGRYLVWEYRGPITADEMRDLCSCMNKPGIAPAGEIDPLTEINVVLWFCEAEVLKFGIHHLDSGETIYSVYNLEKDDSSIWGYGIPALMRDPQKAINGAWRMMMDNAALSSGPQIEIDQDVLQPADGIWSLLARKLWLRKPNSQGKPGLFVHQIPSNQTDLEKIIVLASKFVDDTTSISVLAQGEQGAHTTRTSSGMSLLMNAVNVIFRRFVKNFDDDITIPVIRRLYDWNMQFAKNPDGTPNDDIKGDFDVNARGTSVLLVREIQSQNLLVMANLTTHPILGLLLKAAPLLRKLAQSMMIAPEEVISTDEEIRQRIEKEAAKKPELPPELQVKQQSLALQQKKQEQDYDIAQKKITASVEIARLARDTALTTLAETKNMSLDELKTKIEINDRQIASSERKLAAEAAVTAGQPATEQHGGGTL